MHNHQITQSNIDAYIAHTVDFWIESFEATRAPYHPWSKNNYMDVEQFILSVSENEELVSYLEHYLFIYPILKGEHILSYAKGEILTNYRLVVNDYKIGMVNIPLLSLKHYGIRDVGKGWNAHSEHVIEFVQNGTIVTLENPSFGEGTVNQAIVRLKGENLDDIKKIILSSTYYELKKGGTELKFPKLNWETTVNYCESLVPPQTSEPKIKDDFEKPQANLDKSSEEDKEKKQYILLYL